MHVVHVITRADSIGGAQVHVRDLSLALLRDGHRVTVLAGGTGSFSDELERCGIPHDTIPSLGRPVDPPTDVRAFTELKQLIACLKPDIVASHSSKAGVLGRLAAASLGLPPVFTAHGWAFAQGLHGLARPLFHVVERIAAPIADAVITVSKHDRELALNTLGLKADDVYMVHNGVPDVDYDRRARPGADSPTINLTMVARFDEPKDHSTLLEALSTLKHLPWRLHLVGNGSQEQACRDQADKLGLGQRVLFRGYLDDVTPVLAASHVFVLASKSEGLPLSILEAMRAGLPVIASNVGGVPETVVDGITGFLVPSESPRQLRNALRTLILNRHQRAQMGDEARRRYEREFTLQKMYSRTLFVYRKVLKLTQLRSSDRR